MKAEPMKAGSSSSDCPWHRRARDAVGYSLHLRLVLVFMALAVTVAVAFMGGMQKVVALGWKEAARPLLMDYVDRLTAEIGSPPSIERAQAIADRLPVTLRIDGPEVRWDSHPDRPRPDWMSEKVQRQDHWSRDDTGYRLLHRTTADGHHIEFGLNALSWDKRPRIAWGTLTILLLLTALAYVYVRHLLRPLDDIRRGARRFGNGDFGEPIPVRHAHRPAQHRPSLRQAAARPDARRAIPCAGGRVAEAALRLHARRDHRCSYFEHVHGLRYHREQRRHGHRRWQQPD